MCVISYVGDYALDTFPPQYSFIPQPTTAYVPNQTVWPAVEMVPKEAYDRLKKEVEALKTLLVAAVAFDRATNQPHCEHPDKVKFLRELAKFVDVDLSDVLS